MKQGIVLVALLAGCHLVERFAPQEALAPMDSVVDASADAPNDAPNITDAPVEVSDSSVGSDLTMQCAVHSLASSALELKGGDWDFSDPDKVTQYSVEYGPHALLKDTKGETPLAASTAVRIDALDAKPGAGCGLAVIFDEEYSSGVAASQVGCAIRALGDTQWALSSYTCDGVSGNSCEHYSETAAPFAALDSALVVGLEMESWRIACTLKDLGGGVARTEIYDATAFAGTRTSAGVGLVTFNARVSFEETKVCFAK